MFTEVEVARACVKKGTDANAINATQMMTTLRGFRKPSEFFIFITPSKLAVAFRGKPSD